MYLLVLVFYFGSTSAQEMTLDDFLEAAAAVLVSEEMPHPSGCCPSITKCYLNVPVIIQNPDSRLVMDASETVIKAKERIENYSQLWIVEALGDRNFTITNMNSQKALVIDSGAEEGHNITTDAVDGSRAQQWYVDCNKGAIYKWDEGLAVTIMEDLDFILMAHKYNGGPLPSQKFEIGLPDGSIHRRN